MRALAQWLVCVAPARARGEVGIALVSSARMRDLNQKYRHKNYPTDVLSFPISSSASFAVEICLGDIVIAREVARRQARAAGHSLEAELRILALHGLLHLLGYDHERDQGQMERLETRLRKKGGL
jgi:probable rRNA maturation factor